MIFFKKKEKPKRKNFVRLRKVEHNMSKDIRSGKVSVYYRDGSLCREAHIYGTCLFNDEIWVHVNTAWVRASDIGVIKMWKGTKK